MISLFLANVWLKIKALEPKAAAFLKQYWKLFAAVCLLAMAFFLGRGCAPRPAPVKTVEHVTASTKTSVAVQGFTQKQVNEQIRRALEQERATHTHVVTREAKLPDGTFTKVVTRDRSTNSKASASTEQQVQAAHVEYVDRVVYQDREVTKDKVVSVPAKRPDWHISALIGDQVNLKPLGPGPLVYGVSVERRVLGPVFVGLWGLSNASGGVSVGVAF